MERSGWDPGGVEEVGDTSVDDLESLLQSRTELFRTVADVLSDGLLKLDDEGLVEFANPAVESILSVDRSAIIGSPIQSLVATDAGDQWDGSESPDPEELFSADDSSSMTVPFETGDGAIVPIELSRGRLSDGNGYVCLLKPVRGGALLESIADPMYVVDEDGTIEQVNEAMLEYIGYDRDELIGRSIRELIPAQEYDRVTARLLELVDAEQRRSGTFETTVVTKQGAIQLTEANVTVRTDNDGRYAGSAGVLRDINERKQRERDLELLKQVLTRLVRHNVRNDLNIIQGHAEALQSTVERDEDGDLPGADTHGFGQTIDEHTGAILDTTDRLLDHSEKARRIEAVIETETRVKTDLDDAVDGVVADLRRKYPDADLDIDIETDRLVRAHPKIRAAIRELIENAIEHAPNCQRPTVSVWTDETDGYVTLFVEDESGGLDDTEIDVIKRGSEDALAHGSGVGLWLVRWIVEYSAASMIAHRTEAGSLMGIRFDPPDEETTEGTEVVADHRTLATGTEGSAFVRAPSRVLDEVELDRIHGETVVGRTDELHQLEERYEALEHKGGHAVLVTGERGIGKTTLVEQFLDRLEQRTGDAVIARGVCEPSVTRPYHVFRQIMDECPGWSDLWEPLDEQSTVEDDPGTLEQHKQALFAAVADELRSLASDGPVLIVIEDLQWADQGTVALLEYLIDDVGQWASPIMFLGTYDADAVDSTDAVRAVIEHTADTGRGEYIELEPFGPDEVRSMLAYMLGVEAVPDGLVDAIYEYTGGTPSFVSETGRYLAETLGPNATASDLPSDLSTVALPDSVESSVTDRIESLDDPVRSVLEIGAVIGETVSFDLLRRASDLPETVLVDYVDRLVEGRIWERSDEQVVFVQDVLRETVLAELGDACESGLHDTVAEAIESVYEDSLEDHYGRLAAHHEAAGNAARAVEYYRKAGNQATEAYAHEAAHEFYQRAVELARTTETVDDHQRGRLYTDQAEAHRLTGSYDRAKMVAENAVETAPEESVAACRALGVLAGARIGQSDYDTAREATERQRAIATEIGAQQFEAEAIQRLGLIARRQSEYDTAQEYLQTCLDLAEQLDDRQMSGLVTKELGTVALRQGALDDAQSHYQQALDTAEAIGSRSLESDVLTNLGAVLFREGVYDEAADYFQRALDRKQEISDYPGEATVRGNLGLVALERSQYDQAREHLEESARMKRDTGDRQGLAHTFNLLGLVEGNSGEYVRGQAHLEASIEIGREIDDRLQVAWSLSSLGELLHRQGKLDEAQQGLDEALDLARDVGSLNGELDALRDLGAVALEREKYESARNYFDSAMDVAGDDGDPQSVARVHMQWAKLALAEGDHETARERIEEAEELFADLGTPHWLARCRTVQGRIDAATGHPEAARDHWEDALETFERLGTAQDTLRTMGDLIEQYLDAGDSETAQTWYERAVETIDAAPEVVVEQHGDRIERLGAELSE